MEVTASVGAYAVVMYEDQRWQTATCTASTDPVWKQDFKFHLFKDVSLPTVTIQVFDEHFLGDTFLGSCSIDLTPYVKHNSKS